MSQTIARFLLFDRKEEGSNIKYPYVVWKMENCEGWFWVRFTENSFADENSWNVVSSKKELVGKLALLSGCWKYTEYSKKDGRNWKGWAFRVYKCLFLPDDFCPTSWESVPGKSLREVE